MDIDLSEVRRQFESAWKGRRDNSSRGVAMLNQMLREFHPMILGATDKKVKLRLALSPQITQRSDDGGKPARFVLRGSICLVVGDAHVVVAELGDIENITPKQVNTVKKSLAGYLMHDSVIHGILAFLVTNEYGQKLKNPQEITAKLMARLAEHQLREYERIEDSESWRNGKKEEDDNEKDTDENAFQ